MVFNRASANINLEQCADEQIHLINAIQPHGALLVVTEPELRIVQWSKNIADFLTLTEPPSAQLALESLLGENNTLNLRAQLAKKNLNNNLCHLLTFKLSEQSDQSFHVFANRSQDQLLLEFEVAEPSKQSIYDWPITTLSEALLSLQQASNLQDFLNKAVNQICHFSGFERVMIYRFDSDGSGVVIAEEKTDGLEAYLGLHYPASDIPEPARRLFRCSPLRHLPNIDYQPIALENSLLGNDRQPLDLSYAFFRSVSSIYIEYLRNMGVKATLVMPLLKNDQLWGLISCMHHSQSKYLAYETRIPLAFLGQTISVLLQKQEENDQHQYQAKLNQKLENIISKFGQCQTLKDIFLEGDSHLLSALDASGAALISESEINLLGKTPNEAELQLLLNWLVPQNQSLISTNKLAYDFPDAVNFSEKVCGLLASRLSRSGKNWLIWFRPEVLQEVHWAGDPNKPVILEDKGEIAKLMPRSSFERWKETVTGQARPWLDCELNFALRLQRIVLDMIAERAELLQRINLELECSNQELESFAYAASHDLREPLRGIHHFAEFLKLSDRNSLTQQGRHRLDTILLLTERMNALLESLLEYSRVSRGQLKMRACAIGDLFKQAIDLVKNTYIDRTMQINLQTNFPVAYCDGVRVSFAIYNLLVNAIKYNDKDIAIINISCNTAVEPPVFSIQDNGIGIAANEQQQIFELFHRLHSKTEHGGGTGVGLTITKRVIERHGGQIWLESTPGKGSTFNFTLASGHNATETIT